MARGEVDVRFAEHDGMPDRRLVRSRIAAMVGGWLVAWTLLAGSAARAEAPAGCGVPIWTSNGRAGSAGSHSQVSSGPRVRRGSPTWAFLTSRQPARWTYAQKIATPWTTPHAGHGLRQRLSATRAELRNDLPGRERRGRRPGGGAPRARSNQSEDCLFLNVWTPPGSGCSGGQPCPQAKLPVMVFIHGGAFFLGSGGWKEPALFDGTYLAVSANVVVVTFNYRLGALGFLQPAGVTTAGQVNVGFDDQQKALAWVQENIASFGGDKNNVTIFGESAGAMSVGLHATVASGSKGLFDARDHAEQSTGVALQEPRARLEDGGHEVLQTGQQTAAAALGCERAKLSQ